MHVLKYNKGLYWTLTHRPNQYLQYPLAVHYPLQVHVLYLKVQCPYASSRGETADVLVACC